MSAPAQVLPAEPALRDDARAATGRPVAPARGHRAAAVLVALLGLAAAFAAQLLLVRPGIEAHLTEASRRALAAAGYPQVTVTVEGRDVTLAGVGEGARDQVTRAVAVVPGVFSVRVRPAAPIIETASAAPTPSPEVIGAKIGASPTPQATTPPAPLGDLATVGATLDAGHLVLLGTVPSRSARDRLLARLAQAFPRPDDRLVVDPAAGGYGLEGFAEVLVALGPQARAGAVSLRTGRMDVAAVVPAQTVAAAARAAGSAAVGPDPDTWHEQLTVAAGSAKPTPEQVAAQLDALPPIAFPSRSSELTQQAIAVIDVAAALLEAHPEVSVTIEGHTDATGKPASNLTLSRIRATAVRGALRDAGISARRLTAVGYGSSRPLSKGKGELADAVNRRVVFVARVRPAG